MEFVTLDLEWNGAYSCNSQKYFNEIIEIGAVKLGPDLKEIDNFHLLIKPTISVKLTNIVKNLTNITDDELLDGTTFLDAMEKLSSFLGEDSVIVTWSNTDLHILIENCKAFTGSEKIPFLKRYINMQKLADIYLGTAKDLQTSLKDCAEKLCINMNDFIMHRALDDSILCAEILRKIYDEQSFILHTIDTTNNDFYEKFLFKSYYICDIRSKYIDKRELIHKCDCCGKLTKRMAPFSIKNNAFYGRFLCAKCNKEFNMRVRFKKLFDEVKVSRVIYPVVRQEVNT